MIRALYTDSRNISRSKIDDLPLGILSLAGGTAGCISWAVNYPVDIFKTLLQEDTIKEMLAKEKGELYRKEYTGIYDCAKKVLAQNGFMRGYYRGIGPCLVRAFFNSFALLPTYTKVYNNWPWNN
uniref:Mitochondrial carrier protein n=1 Tax=Amphimedon queenslandica TaxID=400682 RepID=A0A1X7V9D2_AMPQE